MSDLLESERRSGGFLFFRTHEGRVGMIRYWEHYPGPVPVDELETHLRERFGSPDDRNVSPVSLVMNWEAGNRYLKVEAGNRVAQHMRSQGAQSSMQITLWSEDFADYLEAAESRCAMLRKKTRGQLSNEEAADLVKGCLEP
jgi:hypothetical protein